jgi:hypothetical protein
MKGTNRRAFLKVASVEIVAVLSIACPDIEAEEPAPSTLATKVDAARERSRLDEENLLQDANSSFLFSRGNGADRLRYYQRIRDRDSHASIAETMAENEVGARPFGLANPAVVIRANAQLPTSWRSEDGVAAAPPMCAVLSELPEEDIVLVPYAAAKPRITAFRS